jgi:hypothetical protein
MRRALAALTATAVLISAAVFTAPGAVSAATHQLTVTTISRTGAKVKTAVSVVNLSSNSTYQATSGKARKLPKGKYAVLASIYTAADGTSTVGARVVNVSGDTKTTIDARSGRPIKVNLSPASTGIHYDAVRICAKNTTVGGVEAYAEAGKLYVIPHTSTNLRFAYTSRWEEASGTDAGSAYVVTGTATGFPSGIQRTVKRSSLAAITLYARRGPAGAPGVYLAAQSATSGCLAGIFNSLYNGEAPLRLKAYVSPGRWDLRAFSSATNGDIIGSYTRIRNLEGGKNYTQTFFRSAWGPAGRLPYVVRSRLHFLADSDMFSDPGFNSPSYGGEGSAKSVVTLTRGGTTLKKQTRTSWEGSDPTFTYKLTSAGWYTLNVDARRYRPGHTYPADMLSTRSTATYRFHADPKKSQVAPVFVTRFDPQGLDLYNRAKPGSSTTVNLTLQRPKQDPDAKMTSVKPKTVTVRASFDGGKTWRSLSVKQTDGKWSAVVKNPASGVVDLRAKVTDAAGNSSEITVYRAYAIG